MCIFIRGHMDICVYKIKIFCDQTCGQDTATAIGQRRRHMMENSWLHGLFDIYAKWANNFKANI